MTEVDRIVMLAAAALIVVGLFGLGVAVVLGIRQHGRWRRIHRRAAKVAALPEQVAVEQELTAYARRRQREGSAAVVVVPAGRRDRRTKAGQALTVTDAVLGEVDQ
jgi:hypothetical protein